MTDPAPIPDSTYPGWESSVDLGDDRSILFYPDGAVRFRHFCDRSRRTGGPTFVIMCAPKLRIGNGHTVESVEPLTISPSILCPDCGTHGFVRDGRWESC